MNIRLYAATLILVGMAGCTSQDASAPAPPSSAAPAPMEPQATESVNGFALGTYVDPTTYTVGGHTLSFKNSDYIYGVVGLDNPNTGSRVKVSIHDQGKELLGSERVVSETKENTLTFDLNDRKLPTGTYVARVQLNGKPTVEKTIMVVE